MFFGNAAWKQLFMGLVQTLTEGMDITYLEEESEEQISIDYDLDEDEKKIMLGKEYFWIQELFIFSGTCLLTKLFAIPLQHWGIPNLFPNFLQLVLIP